MPKSVIIPAGSSAPLAPFVPGTLADGVVYVSGTLAFDQHNPPRSGNHPQGHRDGGWHDGGCDLQQHLYYRLEKLRRD